MDNVINNIEFRAKDVIQKVWCYGFYSIGINPSSELQEATIQTVNPDGTYGDKISIDRNTVGVWIGKKDKAGRKIFTGDILRMRLPIGYAVGYVMYDTNSCMSSTTTRIAGAAELRVAWLPRSLGICMIPRNCWRRQHERALR